MQVHECRDKELRSWQSNSISFGNPESLLQIAILRYSGNESAGFAVCRREDFFSKDFMTPKGCSRRVTSKVGRRCVRHFGEQSGLGFR